MTIAEALEHEQPHLMPMPAAFDGYVESPARVSSTCLVSAARNRYSVPCAGRTAGQCAAVSGSRGDRRRSDRGRRTRPRASDRDHIVYDWQHYVPLVQRKPGALRNGAPFAEMPDRCSDLRRALLAGLGGDR
jgi:hypothetical protein